MSEMPEDLNDKIQQHNKDIDAAKMPDDLKQRIKERDAQIMKYNEEHPYPTGRGPIPPPPSQWQFIHQKSWLPTFKYRIIPRIGFKITRGYGFVRTFVDVLTFWKQKETWHRIWLPCRYAWTHKGLRDYANKYTADILDQARRTRCACGSKCKPWSSEWKYERDTICRPGAWKHLHKHTSKVWVTASNVKPANPPPRSG